MTYVLHPGTWIKDAIAWLNKFAVMCKNAVGTPYDMCYRSVEKVMKDCEVIIYSTLIHRNVHFRPKN